MKRQSLTFAALALALCAAGGSACAPVESGGFTQQHASALDAAIASQDRTAANVLRDRYRNPGPTLAFFGVRPTDTVVEIWPGGGWYTEILVPYLSAGGGTYIAAAPPPGLARFTEWRDKWPERLKAARQGADPSADEVRRHTSFAVHAFPVFEAGQQGVPNGSADVVLTFRNVHNWRIGNFRNNQDYSADAFRQLYAMLKPGGTLGIVDHRLPENADAERERTSGYMKVSTVRRLAEEAGFRFVASSEINANPRDTADWPQGVWTLPPSYRLGDQDRARYAAIGESDRMTLKFVKPR